MQSLDQAERQARQAVRRLGRRFERGERLSREERKRLREAMALLRRQDKIDEEEIAVRLADRGHI